MQQEQSELSFEDWSRLRVYKFEDGTGSVEDCPSNVRYGSWCTAYLKGFYKPRKYTHYHMTSKATRVRAKCRRVVSQPNQCSSKLRGQQAKDAIILRRAHHGYESDGKHYVHYSPMGISPCVRKLLNE